MHLHIVVFIEDAFADGYKMGIVNITAFRVEQKPKMGGRIETLFRQNLFFQIIFKC